MTGGGCCQHCGGPKQVPPVAAMLAGSPSPSPPLRPVACVPSQRVNVKGSSDFTKLPPCPQDCRGVPGGRRGAKGPGGTGPE